VQQHQVAQQIVSNAAGLRFCIKRVQFLRDLLDGVLAVAQLHNLQAWAAEPKFAPAASSSIRGCWFFSFKRTPGASRGVAVNSGSS